jgi:hypothetical protein
MAAKDSRTRPHACKDEALLNWWNALFLFDALLDSLDCVGGLDVNFNLPARQGFHFHGHAASQADKCPQWDAQRGHIRNMLATVERRPAAAQSNTTMSCKAHSVSAHKVCKKQKGYADAICTLQNARKGSQLHSPNLWY